MRYAEPLETLVDPRVTAAAGRLRALYHICAQITGARPYPICHSEMLTVHNTAGMCAPVPITPTEYIISISYNHPEQDHVPECCFGSQCIGASVPHGSTMIPFGRPLKSFRTRDTRSQVGVPAGMCILCITAYQTVPAVGPPPEGGIAQVFCNAANFGPTDPTRTVHGAGGPYLSNAFHDWKVEEIAICNRVVYYIRDRQLFHQACRTPGSCLSLIRSSTRHA